MPAASSIFIAIDVPERGKPETTTIGWPYLARRYQRLNSRMSYTLGQRSGKIPLAARGLGLQRSLPPTTKRALGVLAVVAVSFFATPVQAYIGPGAGFALVSSLGVVFITVILAF